MIFTDVYGENIKVCRNYSGFLLDEDITAREVLREILSCSPDMGEPAEDYVLFNKTDGEEIDMDRTLGEQGIKNGYELEVRRNVLSKGIRSDEMRI